jgi:Cof subfamily protein (haloacid dehalogenase superfamily)
MKLFFFDIDGTLVNRLNIMPESAWSAIKSLREAGHKCFICSGRNLPSAFSFKGPEFDGVIYNSGGGVRIGDEDIISHAIPEKALEKTMRILDAQKASYGLSTRDRLYTNDRMLDAFNQWGNELGLSQEEIFAFYAVYPLKDWEGEPVQKIDVMFPDIVTREKAAACLDPQVMWSGGTGDHTGLFGEINVSGISKGFAALEVCAYYQCSKDDMYGFGDGMNDLEMFKMADEAYAVENAVPELKALATAVIGSNDEDAVAKWLLENYR